MWDLMFRETNMEKEKDRRSGKGRGGGGREPLLGCAGAMVLLVFLIDVGTALWSIIYYNLSQDLVAY